jgi:soluble lytic murein transglycosylase-like protein
MVSAVPQFRAKGNFMPTPSRTSALLVTAALVAGGTGTATAAQAESSTTLVTAATPVTATSAAAGTPALAAAAATTVKKRKLTRKAKNKSIARPMVRSHGWSTAQFRCLARLWTKESNWNHRAHNRYSGAYGIPQALPGRKMAGAGKDWRTNPKTQIKWGLRYIKQRYGSPCGAWAHFKSHRWY